MSKKDLRILMLEDDPLDAELNIVQLKVLEEYNCVIDIAYDKETFLKYIENTSPDIILSDFNLPNYNGLQALNDIKNKNVLIPFIFVTGTMNEETAADTIKAGAWDYVVKDRLFRLPLAVRSVLKLREEKNSASKAEEKIYRLLTAIEQTSAQIIVTSSTRKIEYVNKRFTEITGFIPEDVIGKDAGIFTPEISGCPSIQDSLNKGEVFRGEVLSKKKDGSLFWELVSITPIKTEDNKILNFVAVKEDITQQKMLEKELIEARDKAEESDKLKEAFLQNLSHEIRTPLNAIVGFSHLIYSDTEHGFSESQKDYASIIQRSSNQLLSIVSDILTVASIETGQERVTLSSVDIHAMINHLWDIFKPLADQKNLKLTLTNEISEKDFVIVTDETKITQILTNLLNNAFKFTLQGEIELKYYIVENKIEFLIKDTGIGIDKESIDIIFERFRQASHTVQSNFGGTGLGLSISKSFAKMLGGDIWVKSENGKGSEFYLNIPNCSNKNKPSLKESHFIELNNKPITILIAEDEIDNFLLIRAYLDTENVVILRAENGYEAFKICESNPQIKLVLMDIKMPVMDGITSFKQIRKIRENLVIVAQTAYALEKDKTEFLEIGFDYYISKPIKKGDLLKIIKLCQKES